MGHADKTDKTINKTEFGVCEKTADGMVTSQNEICRQICGDRLGRRCEDGCMLGYAGQKGFKLVEHVHPDSPAVDAVILNNGETITTFLYDRSPDLDRQMKAFNPHSLTSAELEIVRHALRGFSNREIAKLLFISRPTLRTHLNNIYKKIPEDLKALLLRRGHG